MALFVARARAVDPDFVLDGHTCPDVVEVCRQLEGLPLALELAAARLGLLTPQELVARLSSQLALLVGGPQDLPDRQRTLRGAVDWSHGLLTPGARRLLARLSVVVGEFDLATAEALGAEPGADVLTDLDELVSGSLVRRTARGRSGRFRTPESVRQYAAERLREAGGGKDGGGEDGGEEDTARRRLLTLLVEHVEAARARPRRAEAARPLPTCGRARATCTRRWTGR